MSEVEFHVDYKELLVPTSGSGGSLQKVVLGMLGEHILYEACYSSIAGHASEVRKYKQRRKEFLLLEMGSDG